MLLLCIVIAGKKIAILMDTLKHEFDFKIVTLISVRNTPMVRLLEVLNSKEVDLSEYELFVLILGYNDLEMDCRFFEIYYKNILDTLQLQSPFAKFIDSNLVSEIQLYEHFIHGKNATIKMIKELSDKIFLFNLWKSSWPIIWSNWSLSGETI